MKVYSVALAFLLSTSASATPFPLAPPITTGDYSANIQFNTLSMAGPDGVQTWFFPTTDVFHEQWLNPQGQYLASWEASMDGAAHAAVYGLPELIELRYEFPYTVGDVTLGTYGDFAGHLQYFFSGPPSLTGLVTARVEVGYSGHDYFLRNYETQWTLPAPVLTETFDRRLAATPEPSTGLLLVGSVGLLFFLRLRP